MCDVVIACISNQFCTSVYCTDELHSAKHYNKPLILLFLEEVDAKYLPKSIKTHFQTMARVKVVINEDGLLVFKPRIEILANSIVSLMSEH